MRHGSLSAVPGSIRSWALSLLALGLLLTLAAPAAAQPFGGIFSLSTASPGYIRVADGPALNPTAAITIELWASVGDTGGSCKSLVGKDYVHAYWVGICNRTLRSYLKGSPSLFDGGTIPLGELTHIAVTFDGTTRRHYINGELVASKPETGPLPTATHDVVQRGPPVERGPHRGADPFHDQPAAHHPADRPGRGLGVRRDG
jgi:hypothetical protein